ncbi:MAG: hydantoinase B/oxoprolinase family protein [Candidatus Latescibacterota bacterium]|nr:hydantoinase B/oxoprolinase family protein [Candidatus Latescibacterota bacterium]
MDRWQVWTDTGGTFTDGFAVDPQRQLHCCKVLSHGALRGRIARRLDDRTFEIDSDWQLPSSFLRSYQLIVLSDNATSGSLTVVEHDAANNSLRVDSRLPELTLGVAFEVWSGESAPILAARVMTRTALADELPSMELRLATTRGTNALLERRGAPTALFITKGFADLLRIGDQQRPDLFSLDPRPPLPLYEVVVEVEERMDAAGEVLVPLQIDRLDVDLESLRDRGINCAAVALLHSYRNGHHEQQLTQFLRSRGLRVSASSDLAPLIKILPRAQTSVVDSYLGPVIGDYLGAVQDALGPNSEVHVMTSAGGLVGAPRFRAKDSLLSGPAGGVAGAAAAGLAAGYSRVLTFDMGGTSTDVARFDGDFEYDFEHRVADARLVAPALSIETVAAGGGSICCYEHGRLRVGPESAGADPGPACYGAGGPLTLTDVNLLLGRLDPSRFQIPIIPQHSHQALEALMGQMTRAGEEGSAEPEQVLAGLVEIADDRMAAAIRRVSVERGYDPSDYALVTFGGAGAQHACGVASRLGANTVIVPEDAGLLSAWGLGLAVVERFAERQVLQQLDAVDEGKREEWFCELVEQALSQVGEEGFDRAQMLVRRRIACLRFRGQDSTISVDAPPGANLEAAFAALYRQLYGHEPDSSREIEIESLRVVASSLPASDRRHTRMKGEITLAAAPVQRVWTGKGWRQVPVHERAAITDGSKLRGPALVSEKYSITYVECGWRLTRHESGALLLIRETRPGAERRPERAKAVKLELFTHALEGVAQEMGSMLQRTALSTNVKERLDFSCAVLDAEGRLVVNAPHIPVHLGALGLCARAVAAELDLDPGDTAVTNHPAYGGSHLPDVTLVTPVHAPDGSRLLGYVASRAHHAEIGGSRPGSMPPGAKTLEEEGVIIKPIFLVRDGQARWQSLRDHLDSGAWPSRSTADNIADLEAALAANHRGLHLLHQLVVDYSAEEMSRYMDLLRQEAAAGVRAAISQLPDGHREAVEKMDDGACIQVSIRVVGDAMTIDFSGSAAEHPGNLNATPAIVQSAVIYVLRLLAADSGLPLNEGFLDPVVLKVPRGLLSPDFSTQSPPAVVGGNVETSQRIVDVLLKALDLVAASQGTMNNTLFGTDDWGYYETVCGGAGAGPSFDGASAVHTHMTNTRITDPEILEQRYPVRLERFAVREGSGGEGRNRGGDGAVREITFLAPVSLSMLTQRRRIRPYGLRGGEAGSVGRQRLVRADGETVELDAIDGCEALVGDRLIMETPGGGGYGAA